MSRARRYWPDLLLIAALAIAQSGAVLAIPWLSGRLMGDIVAGAGLPAGALLVLLVAALAGFTVFSIFAAVQARITGAKILADLRLEAYRHTIALPVSFHDRQRQGELLSLISFEVSSLSGFLSGTLAVLPATVITAAGALVALFLLDPALAWSILFAVPLLAIGVRFGGRRLRKLAHHVRLAEADVIAEAEAHLGIVPAIKAFAVEEREAGRYRDRLLAVVHRTRDQAWTAAAIGPAIGFVVACTAIVVLAMAGTRVGSGAMGVEDLFRFLFYALLLTRPVSALGDAYGSFQVARGTLRDLSRLMAEPGEPDHGAGEVVSRSEGRIAFDDVHFAYPGRDPVLAGASFAVESGEVVALTGVNGAGKSTIVSLLLRFYEPSSGIIRLDGKPLPTLETKSLRRQIGYVPQRPLMFNGTVRENIAFGNAEATDQRLAEVIRIAQASDFIAGLPQGLETQIGDHGVLLSGGQRQRLALARALLSDPPILIFDEATSMVDLEGEAAFLEACGSALVGRSVLIITHRPASLALADRVLEVADGRVTEVAVSPQDES